MDRVTNKLVTAFGEGHEVTATIKVTGKVDALERWDEGATVIIKGASEQISVPIAFIESVKVLGDTEQETDSAE